MVIVANTSTTARFAGFVLVDARIHADGAEISVRFSNRGATGTGRVESGPATFHADGRATPGWGRRIFVDLAPMEVQALAPA